MKNQNTIRTIKREFRKAPKYKVLTVWYDAETGEVFNINKIEKERKTYFIEDVLKTGTGGRHKNKDNESWVEFMMVKRDEPNLD